MKIYFIFFFLSGIRAQDIETAYGLKVSNALPVIVEECFLKEQRFTTSGLNAKLLCVSLCKTTPNCLLACIGGQTCRLYEANVSPHWAGTNDVGPELSNSKCYSIWAEHGDLVSSASFTASSVNPGRSLTGASDGLGCSRVNGDYMFVSAFEKNPWIEADVGSPKWIDRVVVQVRGVKDMTIYFENVYARVGTQAGRGNYGASALLMHFQGPAASGEIVTFKGNYPLLGRYVSLQVSAPLGHVIFMEIKIIEA